MSALDAVAPMVLVKGAQSRIVYANRAFRDYYGMSQAQLADLIDAPFNAPDYTQQYIQDDAHVFRTGETRDIPSEPVTRHDGVVRLFHSVKSAVRDEAGQVVLTVGVSEDITEQHEAERQLQAREQLLRAILDHFPAAVVIRDLDGRCLLTNPAATATLGRDQDSLLGQRLAELVPPERATEWQQATTTVMTTGTVVMNEMVQETPDGRQIFFTTTFPIGDAAGRVAAVGDIMSDITALKQAEADARASAASSEAILAAIPGLLFILSDDGEYLDYRTDDENLLLAPAGSFLGKNIREVLPEMAEPFLQLLRAARATGRVQEWAFPAPGPDGMRYFEGQVAPIGPDRILLLTREVTDRKRLEVERERLQEEVIQAQQAALAELSTPLIPLNAEVVVMPLVGTLDSRRAQQVLETLLEGIADSRAGTAIIDITGVPVVDTQVANALIRAAQAVKLLGAQVVLTGIRPEVAQTLMGLGADLSSITTRGSLQAGIAFAMRRA
jgi:rsbT co-antagonist protein RsbR